ncbi:MAG: hypothetical protein ABIZ81_10925 [Opitutaceae bacterium]
MATHRTPPWEKPKPKTQTKKKSLTAENLQWAKARAKKAGRKYPNLVDNLAASRRQLEQQARPRP